MDQPSAASFASLDARSIPEITETPPRNDASPLANWLAACPRVLLVLLGQWIS